MAKIIKLADYAPPMPEKVSHREPALTPAVVMMLMGPTFEEMYGEPDMNPMFASFNNETAVFGIGSFDHAYLVKEAIERYTKASGQHITQKDYARVGKGLTEWMKANNMSRSSRRAIAKQAALAALPPAAE